MSQGRHADTTPGDGGFVIRVAQSIADFSRDDWNSLGGTSRASSDIPYNPFLSYDFLLSLEESGCADRRTGWLGKHLRLEGPDGKLLGAVPCYLKSHSQGEYVFDHGWADAFEKAGGHYYPKLQVSIPFTPATGPRLLTLCGQDGGAIRQALAEGLKRLTTSSAPHRRTSPLRRRMTSQRWTKPDFCTARTSNSISSTRATAATTIFSPPSHRASARR